MEYCYNNIVFTLWKIEKQYVYHEGKCDVSHDLVPFVQYKKREKHPWRSALLAKLQTFSLLLY